MKKNFKLCLANIASRDAKQQFLLPVGETILRPKKIPKEILTLHNIVNIYDSAQRTQMEVKLKVALFLFPFFTVYTLKISNQPGSINFLFIFLFILNLLVAELSLSIVSMRKIKEKERERKQTRSNTDARQRLYPEFVHVLVIQEDIGIVISASHLDNTRPRHVQ